MSSRGNDGRSWLVAKGEMGGRIAAFSWADTPLGSLETWPDHLRTAVNFALEAGAPMAVIWGEDYRFLYNDGYARIIQDKHPAALGMSAVEIFPELWHLIRPLFEQTMRGEAVVMDDLEFPLTRHGTTKPGFFSFSYNPVRGKTGSVDGLIAVVIETTARVLREQERAQVFDTVLSAITDFAYTFDRDGRFIYINKALLDLWGLNLEQAVGKNFFDLNYPGDLAARLQAQIQEVIIRKATIRDETLYVSPTGVEGYYEYIFSPVLGPDGSVRTVAGSTRDITRRKKLEMEALAASKAKDDFLATLSHELRTPLNPVLLLATEAAKNPELPPQVRADFKSIADNVTLEARLIDDLLDISRITHDKLPLSLQPVEVHPLLLRAIDSVAGEIVAKSLYFEKHFDAANAVLNGDPVRLHQVFSNLLRNAVKFTPRGGRVWLKTSSDPAKPRTLSIEVRDTGIGLSADELTKVFNPFAQGEHGDDGAGQFGGLGLGLAISRKIVELHHGEISATSAGRNQGATFAVTLPLARTGDSVAPFSKTSREAMDKPKIAGTKVLLVEDHNSSREVLARLLALRGLEVIQSPSANEALAKASAHAVELVISDIGLPDMPGHELIKLLQEKYSCQGIALSGYGTQEDIQRSRDAGFLAHLTKPVQAHELDAALAQFAAHR